MKVRALKTFEGIKDLERDTYPKAGDVWEVTKKRADFLKSHGVVEFVDEEVKDIPLIDEEKIVQKVFEENKPNNNKKKKHSKK